MGNRCSFICPFIGLPFSFFAFALWEPLFLYFCPISSHLKPHSLSSLFPSLIATFADLTLVSVCVPYHHRFQVILLLLFSKLQSRTMSPKFRTCLTRSLCSSPLIYSLSSLWLSLPMYFLLPLCFLPSPKIVVIFSMCCKPYTWDLVLQEQAHPQDYTSTSNGGLKNTPTSASILSLPLPKKVKCCNIPPGYY